MTKMTHYPVHKEKLDEASRASLERAYAFAKRYNVANGICYDDPLASSSGIQVKFFVFPGTTQDDINKAMAEVIGKRDVVGFTLLEVPADFGGTHNCKPKTLTDKDLARIIEKVVTENHHIDDAQTYEHFLQDLAELVTNYFGGTLEKATHDASQQRWIAVIRHDENVLEGFYEDFDKGVVWPGDEKANERITDKATTEEMEACLRRVEASLTVGSVDDPEIQKVMLTDIRKALRIVVDAEVASILSKVIPVPNKKLPGNFRKAVSLLTRPYIPLTEAEYHAVYEMAETHKTDIVSVNGKLATFGEADGGYALMPLIAQEYHATEVAHG